MLKCISNLSPSALNMLRALRFL